MVPKISFYAKLKIMDILIVLIVILGLVFDYTNGFHDSANVVSTVIATGVLAPLSAIVMAGVLNFIGATQISGVAQTIATGLVHAQETSQIAVLSAVIGAIAWNLLTWYYGLPSSSSYALIGGLIGAAWVEQGVQTILWKGVIGKVLIPMFVTPVIGFILAFSLMKALHWYLSYREQDHGQKLSGTFRSVRPVLWRSPTDSTMRKRAWGSLRLAFLQGAISKQLTSLFGSSWRAL